MWKARRNHPIQIPPVSLTISGVNTSSVPVKNFGVKVTHSDPRVWLLVWDALQRGIFDRSLNVGIFMEGCCTPNFGLNTEEHWPNSHFSTRTRGSAGIHSVSSECCWYHWHSHRGITSSSRLWVLRLHSPLCKPLTITSSVALPSTNSYCCLPSGLFFCGRFLLPSCVGDIS